MVEQSYHELIVWKEAHKFVLDIYRITKEFLAEEKFGITSQLRRAAVSVPTNIVEGYAKKSSKDLFRFFDIARGSIKECAYLLELSKDLGYLSQQQFDTLQDQRTRTDYLLTRFISSQTSRPS